MNENQKIKYILFLGEVNSTSSANLKNEIIKAVQEKIDDLHLLISSGGGNVIEGLNIATVLKTLPIKVTTYNIGQTDSVANVIFAAGSKRIAKPTASFLFHGVLLNFEKQSLTEMQIFEQYQNAKRLRESIISNFSEYTGIKIEEVQALSVDGGNILNAQQALEKGIVHEIVDFKIPQDSNIITIGGQ